jgi:cbb3-type cytochrome c oxidase subunit I
MALAMLGYSSLLGLAVSLKLHTPDFLGSSAWLTWGRLRPGHVQGILFGWLGNAFLVFLYHAVPPLAGRPVTSRVLGWALFIVWNFLFVIPGWALVMAGKGQWIEWAEFPLNTDVFAIAGLALMAVQFVFPLLRARLAELYVSAWYILGAIVFTLLAYPVGNFVPEFVPGARGATFSGLWIHDAVGLYITPLAVAIAYFVIPLTTGRPIFSHFLSMVAFWMLFFVYPLNGTHHYVFSSIPMDAQLGAIVASIYLGMDVVLNVTNQLLSLRGSSGVVGRDVALRYTWVGIVCYLLVSLQGSMQAVMPVNRLVHFTDWVIGHAHLAMIGFASFAAIGGMLHVWERTPGARYNARAAGWSFWLTTVGLVLMAVDLTAAGLLQGALWQTGSAWIESVRVSGIYWVVRSVAGFLTLAGFLALGLSMTSGPVGRLAGPSAAGTEPVNEGFADESDEPFQGRGLAWLQNAYALTGMAGVGFFVFSFVVLAVWPNRVLERRIAATRPPDLPRWPAGAARGRAVYGREGCAFCHTQLVRFTDDDVRRFGEPSQAWESDLDTPQLWGTRRIGPDLAREAGRRPRDWQIAHLWNPRDVVPDSVMPAYPWLFDGSPRKPTIEALDLVAYLDSLGRPARLAGGAARSNGLQAGPESDEWCGVGLASAVPPLIGPAPLFTTPTDPAVLLPLQRRGAGLFERHCQGCHGLGGRGWRLAETALLPSPRDLTSALYSDRRLSDVLWSGVPGTSMPPWNELSSADLRALAAYVRSLAAPAAYENERFPSLAAVRIVAQSLFEKNCALCHGKTGRGDGFSARVLAPAPTNFQQVRPEINRALQAVDQGIAGTAMPPWDGKLSEAERLALALYVRSFYRPEVPSAE